MSLKIICAWCERELGVKGAGPVEGITHGLCKKCKAEQLAKIKKLEKKS